MKYIFQQANLALDSSLLVKLDIVLRKIIFLYTCIQNPCLRTVYRQRKWPLPAPACIIMALGCQVFHYSVKCSKRGLRGFYDAVQRGSLMSVNGEPTRASHAFVKKNMVRCMRPHGRFAY